MHLRRLENICEKKEQHLSCNENLSDPKTNLIVRIDSEAWSSVRKKVFT
jgi:hypothetical protein